MAQIIESIPNISEGRNQEVIEACVDQIRTTPGCTLLNYSSDPNHNRTVITYIGDAKGVEEASVKLAKKAVELIDLTKHEGEHPRMGSSKVWLKKYSRKNGLLTSAAEESTHPEALWQSVQDHL